MKILSFLLALTLIGSYASSKETVYQGSTPADTEVRDFLDISLTDSIDFIRWRISIGSNHYELNCQYGLSRGGTNGFVDEQRIALSGELLKQGHYWQLQSKSKTLYVLEINPGLLHLLDKNKSLLVGNGGYSYALNNTTPVKTDQFNHSSKQTKVEHLMAYQGRTPCQELSVLLGRNSSQACNKLKWYIVFFADSLTGKPLYYLEGGRGYKKETMAKGSWDIIQKKGRVIYKLVTERRTNPLYLLKADDNILFFVDAESKLLVGNEDFSYTLNRTEDREPLINK